MFYCVCALPCVAWRRAPGDPGGTSAGSQPEGGAVQRGAAAEAGGPQAGPRGAGVSAHSLPQVQESVCTSIKVLG